MRCYLQDELHFAAHPMKSQVIGETIDVEMGQAEWNLNVLDSLFDFYFVQPAIAAEKKRQINAKLKEAGKPTL
jgi:hypothetical protein